MADGEVDKNSISLTERTGGTPNASVSTTNATSAEVHIDASAAEKLLEDLIREKEEELEELKREQEELKEEYDAATDPDHKAQILEDNKHLTADALIAKAELDALKTYGAPGSSFSDFISSHSRTGNLGGLPFEDASADYRLDAAYRLAPEYVASQSGWLDLLQVGPEDMIPAGKLDDALKGVGRLLQKLLRRGGKKALRAFQKSARRMRSQRSDRTKRRRERRKRRRECYKKGGGRTPKPVMLPYGTKFHEDARFEIPGLLPLVIGSSWYGGVDRRGVYGNRRLSDIDAVILRLPDRRLQYLDDANGDPVHFNPPTPNPDNWEECDSVRNLKLLAGENRTFILKDGSEFRHFRKFPDGVWRMSKVQDRNGNAILHDRHEDGRLLGLTTPEGLAVHFRYNAQGLRVSATLASPNGEQKLVMRWDYDASGNMTLSECPYGDTFSYTYDERNNLASVCVNGAHTSHYVYDEQDRVIAYKTDKYGDGDRFIYDDEKRIVTYLPLGKEEMQERVWYRDTPEKNIFLEANALGHLKTTLENETGRVAAKIDAEDNRTDYTYDADGNIKSITDPEGRTTFFFYDDDGNLEILIEPEAASWDYHYDEKGNLTAVENANRFRTDITNNEQGQPVGIMRHDGLIRQNSYDEHHHLSGMMDFNGAKTFFERDVFGRIVQITDALGAITRFEYSDQPGWNFWKPSTIVRPDGDTISYTAKDRCTLVADEGEGRKATYRYDAFGNLLQVTDASGRNLFFHYDAQERLEKVTNQNGLDWAFEWDDAGRITREVDFDGQTYTYAYDKADRLIETCRGDGRRTAYTYDKSGLLTEEAVWETAAAEPDKVTFDYNGRGLLEKIENNHSVIEFEYDANGQVIAESTNGHRIESDYDCCGLRAERRIFGLDRVSPPAAPEGMEGLAEGLQALSEMRGTGPTTHLGILLQQTNYAYDPLGGLRELKLGGATGPHAPLQFVRDQLGRETARSSAAGFSLMQGYDVLGQLSTQRAGRGFGAIAETVNPERGGYLSVERNYGWNRFFEPTRIDDSRWGSSFYSYDKRGQVSEARLGDGFSERFSYDPAHNIEAVNEYGATQESGDRTGGPASGTTIKVQDHRSKGAGSSAPLNRILHWKSSKGGRVEEARGARGEYILLTYDGFGRVIKRRVERNGFRPKEWHFEWDGRDRLGATRTPDGSKWSYTYDPLGRRLSKTQLVRGVNDDGVAGDWEEVKTISFLWDGDVPVWEEEQTPSGTRRVEWYFEPDTFVPIARLEGNQLCYVVTDHLGSPRELLSEDGQAVWSADYTTWGLIRRLWQADNQNELGPQGPFQGYDAAGNPVYTTRVMGNGLPPVTGNLALKAAENPDPEFCPIRFQGQWADIETGLHYNRFRYYDPEAAQYLTPDPIGISGGFREQGYVLNPTIWIDVLGLNSALRNALGLVPGDGMQAHHVIPKEVWKFNQRFFDAIGMGGQRDVAANGIAIPKNAQTARQRGLPYHCGSHPLYSGQTQVRVESIADDFRDGLISASQARTAIQNLQNSLRQEIRSGLHGLPGTRLR